MYRNNKKLGYYSTTLSYREWVKFRKWAKKHNNKSLTFRIYNKFLYLGYCTGKTHVVNKQGTKDYYIIRSYQTGNELCGIFASFRFVMAHICWALRKGYIPVVDMQNGPQTYLEENEIGQLNAWELFFRQPCGIGLDDIPESAQRVIISEIYEKECETGLLTNEMYEISRKHIRLEDKLEKDTDTFFTNQKQAGNNRILGIKLRGSDYVKTRPKYHPVQPTIDEAIHIIENKIAEWKNEGYTYDAIFLATEDQSIADGISKHFQNIIIPDSQRIEPGETWYNTDSYSNDKKKQGYDYCLEVAILSRCNALIASGSQGTIAAQILNHGEYEKTYIIEKGSY